MISCLTLRPLCALNSMSAYGKRENLKEEEESSLILSVVKKEGGRGGGGRLLPTHYTGGEAKLIVVSPSGH